MNRVLLKFLVFFIFTANAFANQADYMKDNDMGMEAYRNGNLILAMKLLNQASIKGYSPAQTTLAHILDQAEEDERAFKLYKQAAEKNYSPAQFGLGNMYAKGEGTEKNTLLAGQLIMKSALQHHVPAMRAYAYALEFGNLGFIKNDDLAFKWYEKCSYAGDLVCTRRLVQVYTLGDLNHKKNKERADELKKMLNLPVKEST